MEPQIQIVGSACDPVHGLVEFVVANVRTSPVEGPFQNVDPGPVWLPDHLRHRRRREPSDASRYRDVMSDEIVPLEARFRSGRLAATAIVSTVLAFIVYIIAVRTHIGQRLDGVAFDRRRAVTAATTRRTDRLLGTVSTASLFGFGTGGLR